MDRISAPTHLPDAPGAAGIDPEDLREYDGFGPWILEVKRLEDMPRRFRALHGEHADARFLLKMPRNEERRYLRPGMDLYPSVLAVHDERVCLLVQAGERIEQHESRCREIQGIQVVQNLLRGQLNLLMADGTVAGFGYNASSQPVIDRVVAFLGQRFPEPARTVDLGPDRSALVEDLAFRTALADQGRHLPGHRVLHYEAPGRPCRDREGRRRLSLGILVLGTSRELVLLTQGKPSRRRREGVFANETVHLPWANLAGCRPLPVPALKPATWQTLELKVGRHLWPLDLFEPERVLDCLESGES